MPAIERSRDVAVTMPDGVILATDVWRPAGATGLPTLVQRLPYGRAVASTAVLPHPVQLARLGYAVVVQDVRGTGDSEGVFSPFREGVDGATTIEWAAAQPFSTGEVISYGFSYQGFAQLQAAALRPRGLRGVAALMCPGDPYEFVYENGVLKQDFATLWGAQLSGLSRAHRPRAADDTVLPLSAAMGADPPPWYREWLEHESRDDYWQALGVDLDAIEVPIFTVLGYADVFAAAADRLVRRTGARVVAGPWVHMPWGTALGGLDLAPEAGPGMALDALLDFFAETFGDEPSVATWPATTYYVVGSGWRDGESWPPVSTPLHLQASSAGRGANSRFGDGRLLPAGDAPVERLDDLIVSEPLNPVPGADLPYPAVAATEDRRDVLCYTAAPLRSPLAIAGSPSVVLTASAPSGAFDLVAALIVDTAAGPRQIAMGAARVSGETPDALVEVAFDLSPTGWLAPTGACLRLEVSASRFPRYARNPQRPATTSGHAARADFAVTEISLVAASLVIPTVPATPVATTPFAVTKGPRA